MKTETINSIKYEAHEAPHGTSPCSLCCVKPCYSFGHLNSYKSLCMKVPNGYLKRAIDNSTHLDVCCSAGGGHSSYMERIACADDSTVKCTNCEELTKKLTSAHDALKNIFDIVVKLHKSETEIKALCCTVLERTK